MARASGKGRGKGRWLWSESAVGALEVLRPEVYAGWDAGTLGKALAARNVPTSPMNRQDGERRHLVGFDEAGLRAAVEAAARRSGPPDGAPE